MRSMPILVSDQEFPQASVHGSIIVIMLNKLS